MPSGTLNSTNLLHTEIKLLFVMAVHDDDWWPKDGWHDLQTSLAHYALVFSNSHDLPALPQLTATHPYQHQRATGNGRNHIVYY